MQSAGVQGVRIERHEGFLSDHYDPLAKVAVAAHEAPAMPFRTRWATCPWCGAGGAGEHGDCVHPAGIRWCEAGAGCRRPHLRGGRGVIAAAADRSCVASTQVRSFCLDRHADATINCPILMGKKVSEINDGTRIGYGIE